MAITLGTDGYCVIADVQARFGQRTFAASSKPSSTEVEAFITQGFNKMNGVLKAVGYSTPVAIATAVKSLEILRVMNANYAASEAHLAAFSAGVGGVPEQAEYLMGLYKSDVKDLQKGLMSLEDATTTSDLIKLANDDDPEGKFNLDSSSNETDPVFTRTMDF